MNQRWENAWCELIRGGINAGKLKDRSQEMPVLHKWLVIDIFVWSFLVPNQLSQFQLAIKSLFSSFPGWDLCIWYVNMRVWGDLDAEISHTMGWRVLCMDLGTGKTGLNETKWQWERWNHEWQSILLPELPGVELNSWSLGVWVHDD